MANLRERISTRIKDKRDFWRLGREFNYPTQEYWMRFESIDEFIDMAREKGATQIHAYPMYDLVDHIPEQDIRFYRYEVCLSAEVAVPCQHTYKGIQLTRISDAYLSMVPGRVTARSDGGRETIGQREAFDDTVKYAEEILASIKEKLPVQTVVGELRMSPNLDYHYNQAAYAATFGRFDKAFDGLVQKGLNSLSKL